MGDTRVVLLGGAASPPRCLSVDHLPTTNPAEVARVEAQATAAAGGVSPGMVTVMRNIVKEYGVQGLFAGVVPRIGLGIWQTLFMVTGVSYARTNVEKFVPLASR